MGGEGLINVDLSFLVSGPLSALHLVSPQDPTRNIRHSLPAKLLEKPGPSSLGRAASLGPHMLQKEKEKENQEVGDCPRAVTWQQAAGDRARR